MTYQRMKSVSHTSGPDSSSPQPGLTSPASGQTKPLNSEVTWTHRECQTTLAQIDRKNSTIRNDVKQTNDIKAFDKMFEYIRSDTKTLDVHKDSEVAAFYKGRSIFITGASGFVGKVSWLHLRMSYKYSSGCRCTY